MSLLKYNKTSVIIFLGIIILAHLFPYNLYNWTNNTISELAAQGYKYRWVMKVGFILFGGILAIGIGNKLVTKTSSFLLEIPILIYAIAIFISGLYSTKPIALNVEYSEFESQIHSYAAQIAGIAFSIGVLIHGITEDKTKLKLIHFSVFIFVITFSALFGLFESNIGIIQRIMYLGSFVWLALFYNTQKREKKN